MNDMKAHIAQLVEIQEIKELDKYMEDGAMTRDDKFDAGESEKDACADKVGNKIDADGDEKDAGADEIGADGDEKDAGADKIGADGDDIRADGNEKDAGDGKKDDKLPSEQDILEAAANVHNCPAAAQLIKNIDISVVHNLSK